MMEHSSAANTSSSSHDEASESASHDGADSTSQSSQSKRAASGHGGHKRNLSGSILARLPFLRTSFEELPSPGRSASDEGQLGGDSGQSGSKEDPAPRSSMAAIVSKTRRRKGSLRKTAIMGTREKRGHALDQLAHSQGTNSPGTRGGGYFTLEPASADSSAESTPVRESFEHDWDLHQHRQQQQQQEQQQASFDSSDGSPPKPHVQPPPFHTDGVPVLAAPGGTYASTTDDDEGLSMSFTRSSSSAAKASYLQPTGSSLLRRRSTVKPSPLTRDVSQATTPPEWDYSETEWWGWAILALTWIVFVVGVGSCLGVWSWAWDVGQTPRAPPELEDDPTLPIVGYYPALMVLTAVMAWVWVIVAWVGIKIFRHAKVVGD